MRKMIFAAAILLAASGLVGPEAGRAYAGGGIVLPSGATPDGYSLTDMAAITAYYNSTYVYFNGSSNSPPNPVPTVPFEILVADATVSSSTLLYVPVFYTDDAGGAAPGFPTDVTNRAADAAFLANDLLQGYGITSLFLKVDGQITTLDGSYVAGAVSTQPLLDGAPPDGSNYIVSAAFLTPLTLGVHTVDIGGFIDGAPVVFIDYTVNSVPEPSSLALMGLGGLVILGASWRRRFRPGANRAA